MAKRKAKIGRPRFFDDPAKVDVVLNAIRLGLSRNTACKIAGCSDTIVKDEADRNPIFLERLKEAEGQCEEALVAIIYNAGVRGEWTAAAWLLERKFNRWRRRDRKQVEAPANEAVKAIADAFKSAVTKSPDEPS